MDGQKGGHPPGGEPDSSSKNAECARDPTKFSVDFGMTYRVGVGERSSGSLHLPTIRDLNSNGSERDILIAQNDAVKN